MACPTSLQPLPGSAWVIIKDFAAPIRARLTRTAMRPATMTTCLWYDCKRHQARSAWMNPSVLLCAFLKNACVEPRPLPHTVPASAPPQPHLLGHFWVLVLAKETVPQPPAANPPAQALKAQARQTVGGAQTPRPQKEWKSRKALIFVGALGPQLWPWHGWNTAAQLPLASGN